MRTLVTERLTLEPLQAHHAEQMFGGLSDPELYQFLDDRPPLSAETLRLRYERLARRQSPDGREQWWNWALRQHDQSHLIGYVQATIVTREAEISYVLFRPYWFQGLASEAVVAMIRYLRESGVDRICARTDEGNLRSRGLLERLNFERRPLPEFMRDEDPTDTWYVLESTGTVDPGHVL